MLNRECNRSDCKSRIYEYFITEILTLLELLNFEDFENKKIISLHLRTDPKPKFIHTGII